MSIDMLTPCERVAVKKEEPERRKGGVAGAVYVSCGEVNGSLLTDMPSRHAYAPRAKKALRQPMSGMAARAKPLLGARQRAAFARRHADVQRESTSLRRLPYGGIMGSMDR